MSASNTPHDYIGERQQKAAVKVAPNPLYRVIRVLASLRLTVILFSLGMALVFFGTLGMTQDSIEGTVRVSKEADSKEKRLVFRGVHIDRQGKQPLVVTYGADDLWRDFDGQRVWLKYEPYTPEGRGWMERVTAGIVWRVAPFV